LNYLWEITKNEVDTQFRIAERIDAKARGLFALTGAIFAATQAFALRKDVLNELSNSNHDALVWIAFGSGFLALVALLTTAFATFRKADKSAESGPLLELLNDWKYDRKDDRELADAVVRGYVTLLGLRRGANVSRSNRLLAVQITCSLAIIASGIELLFAVYGLK